MTSPPGRSRSNRPTRAESARCRHGARPTARRPGGATTTRAIRSRWCDDTGGPSWYVWQAAYSARHLQRAAGRDERAAIVHGLWDGLLGRMGENPRYARSVGEFSPATEPGDAEPDPR